MIGQRLIDDVVEQALDLDLAFLDSAGGRPLLQSIEDNAAYLGYLVRSKPPAVTEGGIHSGYGVLDSLIPAP